MIHFPGKIPVTIHPAFWIFAALIGYLNSGNFLWTLIWMGIIVVSVLIHEFGHALTALFFGQKPRIELIGLGGLTYHDGGSLPFWKQFFIVLNGPVFGFLIYVIASWLLHIPSLATGRTGEVLSLTRIVNLFWTIVNLLPVLPLDGGQLVRVVLEGFFGARGIKIALFISMAIAVGISLIAILYQAYILGAFFFLFAFQSYDTYRKTRHLSDRDRDDGLRDSIQKLEAYMTDGQKELALPLCEEIRAKTKEGMFYEHATQYLAILKYEKGDPKGAYDLLLPIRKDLALSTLCLLHKVAFDLKDFNLVIAIGSSCFQALPTPDTALRNAIAHAQLKQSTPAIGWLQTAINEGLSDVQKILSSEAFDFVRHDPTFQDLHKNK